MHFKFPIFIIFLTLMAPMLQQKINGQTALVTGASRGIGRALVQQLIADNIHVIAVVRNKEALNDLLQNHPDALEVITADLSSPEECLRIASQVNVPKIDFLIHNAAIIEPLGTNALIDAPAYELMHILNVNLVAPIVLTNALKAKLGSGSRILNISSRAGDSAGPGVGMYCISKAALDMYTESLQLDRPHGILCASVHPGEVDTGMQEDLRKQDPQNFPLRSYFQNNQKENKLIPPHLSARYLKWLLLQTSDDEFVKQKHYIYDQSHHLKWNSEIISKPY